MPVKIYVDMCADLFHAGHVAYLKQCKQFREDGMQSDESVYLIVGIHNDKTITGYKRTPVCTMDERAEVVRACKYVDEVVLNAPLAVASQFLKDTGIDFVIHGSEISDADKAKMYGNALSLGIYREVPRTPGISTTAIIDRISARGL